MSTIKKIALVTGGSRGLGKNISIALAKKGIDVVLTYNSSKEEAGKVVSEIQLLGQKAAVFQLDVRNVNQLDNFIKQVTEYLQKENESPNFDFLVNNAGTGIYAPVQDITEEQLDDTVNVHFKGVFFLTQKSLPFLNDGGGIVNISSSLARTAMPGASVYGAMKAAAETLTRNFAKELGVRKIRVNTVAPGAIMTDFGGGSLKESKDLQEHIASLAALGRVGLPDDIGGVVAFLCTDDSGWINGQRIEVSGGLAL